MRTVRRGQRRAAWFDCSQLATALVVLTCLCHESLAAQQNAAREPGLIHGRLLDEQTRGPVRLAGIHLVQADNVIVATVMTDEDGRFRVVTPAPGVYRLRAERLGYEPNESRLLTVAAGETVDHTFHLSPGPLVLDSLLVMGRTSARRALGPTEQIIHGRLLDDDTRLPIREGTVRLIHSNGSPVHTTVTDTLGLFRLVAPFPGDYRIRADRIGYTAGESPKLHVMLKDTIRLDFFLDTDAVLLDPILVTASARPWSNRYELRGMEAFFRRMSSWRQASSFLTRDTIHWYDRLGLTTSQMIRDATLRRGHGCSGGVSWWLDGNPLDTSIGLSIDDLWPPAMIEAVEIHIAHPIPGELQSGFVRSPCAVIVLWTVREPRRRRAP